MNKHRLEVCQEHLRYAFKQPEILHVALTHKSAAVTASCSNERLEFLGDSFLGLVISTLVYHRFPQLQEGALSMIRAEVVSRRSCTRLAKDLHLEEDLIIAGNIRTIPDSILANLMEAVIAAIYLDGGIEPAWKFVEEHFAPLIDEAAQEIDHSNFKALLQTEAHKMKSGTIPQYLVLDEQGPDHHKCFKVQVQFLAKQYQAAWGNTKKEAEQRAAENALSQLRNETPPWTDGEGRYE